MIKHAIPMISCQYGINWGRRPDQPLAKSKNIYIFLLLGSCLTHWLNAHLLQPCSQPMQVFGTNHSWLVCAHTPSRWCQVGPTNHLLLTAGTNCVSTLQCTGLCKVSVTTSGSIWVQKTHTFTHTHTTHIHTHSHNTFTHTHTTHKHTHLNSLLQPPPIIT